MPMPTTTITATTAKRCMASDQSIGQRNH
jgi:hypothetical protein